MIAPEATRTKIKRRQVPVKAHTRTAAAKPDPGAVASGQRYAKLGQAIAEKHYADKPLQQRKADIQSARNAGPTNRTRGQRVLLQTHSERTSEAGQARAALAKRYGDPKVADLIAAAYKGDDKKLPPVDSNSIMKSRLATAGFQAQALRDSLKNAKHTFLDRGVTNATAFTMKQVLRPSSAIASGVLGAIEDPHGVGQPSHSDNSFTQGFLHPAEHAEDFNKVAAAAGIHNKFVQGAVGLTASIVTDPLTYVTFGTGTLAKEAGAQAAKEALHSGAPLEDALRAGRRAAEATGPAGEKTGIKVGVRGRVVNRVTGKREVMTRPMGGPTRVRVAAATKSRMGSRATGKGAFDEAFEGARRNVMNPNVKPRGWSDYEWEIAKQAGNTGRAAERAAQHGAKIQGHMYQQATKGWTEDQHLKVLDALEHKDLSALDDQERKVAETLQRTTEHWYRNEPGRTELGPDARMGYAHPPEAPAIPNPVEKDDLLVARARVQNAADAAERRHATREYDLLKGQRGRERKVIRDFTRDMQAYHAAPEGYAPRRLKPEELHPEGGYRRPSGRGPKIGGSTSYQGRQHNIPLSEMEPDVLAQFETNIPKLVQARSLEHGRIKAAEEQHKWMAGLADPVDMSVDEAKALTGNKTARLYARDEMGIHPLYNTETGEVDVAKLKKAITDGHEVSAVDPDKLATVQNLIQGGRRVHVPDPADLLRPQNGESRENFLRRTQRAWKWWATAPNPSYHLRNMVGDTFNAVLAGTTSGDFREALKLNRANSAVLAIEKSLESPEGKRALETLRKAATKSEHYPGVAQDLTDLEVIGLANKYGAINTGLVSGELRELQLAGEGPVVKATHVAPVRDAIQKAGDYRENIARLATFRNGLKRGLTPPEAAAYSLRHHIDYSNLSNAETGFWRYAVPFWTWWSRNLPLQVTKVATKPGVYANVEKSRRQSLVAAGMNPNIAESMDDTSQENLPWGTPFHVGSGNQRVPVAAGPGLSYSDLGSLPYPRTDVTATMKAVGQDTIGRVNPFAKLGVEELSGVDPFTFEPHEKNNEGKYVPAPAFLPESFPGVKTKYNKKTGKMEKMVNWRVLSAVNTVPVATRTGKIMAPEAQPGKPGPGMALAGWLTGPRYVPVDPRQLRLNQLYDQRATLDSWITEHKGDQKHQSGAPWTGKVGNAYKKRSDMDKQINQLRRGLGFKNVKVPGRPKGSTSGGGLFGAPGQGSGTFGAGG